MKNFSRALFLKVGFYGALEKLFVGDDMLCLIFMLSAHVCVVVPFRFSEAPPVPRKKGGNHLTGIISNSKYIP